MVSSRPAHFALAAALLLGCGGTSSSSTATTPGSGQGTCDRRAEGLCVAYPGDTAAQKSACEQAGGSYAAPSFCTPADRIGTCACEDTGQALGPGRISLYEPRYSCASAKAACATACAGRPGTFNGGC